MMKALIFPYKEQGYYILSGIAILLGLFLYFLSNYQAYWLIAIFLVIVPILAIKAYFERRKKSQTSLILKQLAVDILDTGVIIFDMHSEVICCSIWIPHSSSPAFHCQTFSTNAKYDMNMLNVIIPTEQQAVLTSIQQRAQVYEIPAEKRAEGLSYAVSKLESNWAWRLITPVFDAVDRLRVIGILVIEGRKLCELIDLNQRGLDKAATMISSQICEVLSVSQRIL